MALNTKSSPKLSNIKDNHLLKGMMFEHFDREMQDSVKNELRIKFKCYVESYAKGREMFESL